MLYGIFQGIDAFLTIFRYVLLIYCVLSWVMPPYHKVMRILSRFTDPVLRPIRSLLFQIFPRLPIDLSALAAFLLLNVAGSLLWQLYRLIR